MTDKFDWFPVNMYLYREMECSRCELGHIRISLHDFSQSVMYMCVEG